MCKIEKEMTVWIEQTDLRTSWRICQLLKRSCLNILMILHIVNVTRRVTLIIEKNGHVPCSVVDPRYWSRQVDQVDQRREQKSTRCNSAGNSMSKHIFFEHISNLHTTTSTIPRNSDCEKNTRDWIFWRFRTDPSELTTESRVVKRSRREVKIQTSVSLRTDSCMMGKRCNDTRSDDVSPRTFPPWRSSDGIAHSPTIEDWTTAEWSVLRLDFYHALILFCKGEETESYLNHQWGRGIRDLTRVDQQVRVDKQSECSRTADGNFAHFVRRCTPRRHPSSKERSWSMKSRVAKRSATLWKYVAFCWDGSEKYDATSFTVYLQIRQLIKFFRKNEAIKHPKKPSINRLRCQLMHFKVFVTRAENTDTLSKSVGIRYMEDR